jgi:putative tricarboxylic transport membrane protein
MSKFSLRPLGRLALPLAALLAVSASPVQAAWPEKPITIIVPFGAGGVTDITARTFQKAAADHNLLPQPIAVLNVTGGTGGSVGSTRAKTAAPDGYTFLLLHLALMSAEASGQSPNSYRDFEPIAGTTNSCMASIVPQDARWKTFKELMDEAKAKPNTIPFATNLGSVFHMTTLIMQNSDPGAEFRLVQVGGESDAITSLKGGHTAAGLLSVGSFLRYKAEGFRMLAVLAPERQPGVMEYATAKEQGYDASLCIEHWWFAPKGTPKEAIDGMAAMLKKALETDYLKKALFDDRGMALTYDSGPGFAKKLDATFKWIEPLAKSVAKK